MTLGMVMECEVDWRETEWSVVDTVGHVECRQAVFSCQVCCEEGRSNKLTGTVGGVSEVALSFLSGRSVCLSVCTHNAQTPNIQSNDVDVAKQAVIIYCA